MFCLIEHLDVWILSPLLVGGVCFVLLFVLARCARVEPQRSFHSTDSAGMQMWCRAAKLSSCDVFTPEICYTHTHSHRLTQTHTHYVGTLLGCVGGEAVDGRVTQLGWQLSSGLGSALRHRLHVLMVLAGHTHPPTYTHTHRVMYSSRV